MDTERIDKEGEEINGPAADVKPKKTFLRACGSWTDIFPIAVMLTFLLIALGDLFSSILSKWVIPAEQIGMKLLGDADSVEFLLSYWNFFGIWIVFIVVALLFRDNRPMLKAFFYNRHGNNLKAILAGILLGFGINGFCILMSCIMGDIKLSYSGFAPVPFFAFLICVMFQSGAEEIADRCYLYQKLRRRYRWPAIAVIVNSLFFMSLHMGNPGVTQLGLLQVFLIGVLFSLIVYFWDSLWTVIWAHTAWNFSQSIVFGLPNSGIVSKYSVFKLEAASARDGIFYNTSFGVEGSLGANVIIAAAIVIVLIFGLVTKRGEKKDYWEELENSYAGRSHIWEAVVLTVLMAAVIGSAIFANIWINDHPDEIQQMLDSYQDALEEVAESDQTPASEQSEEAVTAVPAQEQTDGAQTAAPAPAGAKTDGAQDAAGAKTDGAQDAAGGANTADAAGAANAAGASAAADAVDKAGATGAGAATGADATGAGAATGAAAAAKTTAIPYRYASKEEGAKLMLANEAYYAGFSQNDLDYKTQKKGASMEEYQSFAAKQVLDFSEKDKALLDEIFAEMEKTVKDNGYQLPPLDEIVLIKTTMEEECGVSAYTHGTQIYLSGRVLEVVGADKENASTYLRGLLWHEMFHCLTRCNPQFRADLYKLIHFTVQEKEYKLPPSAFEYHISNPDVEHHNSYATFRINGKDIDCFTDFVTTKHFEQAGDLFFDNATTALIPVDGTDTYYTPEQAENFDEIFGKNTDYVIDPEECMADNFSFALTYGMDGFDGNGYPNPEIIEGILAYISR